MRPSERNLAYCAVILTLLALTIWTKFFQVRPHPQSPPEPMTLPRLAKHVSRSTTNTETTPGTIAGTASSREFELSPTVHKESAPPVVEPVPPVAPPPVKISSTTTRSNISSAVGTVAGSVIRGTVYFKGTPPKPKRIKADADPVCAAMHTDQPLFTEEVLVNNNGALRNAFVYIADGIKGSFSQRRIYRTC